jgi:hypothetical protein
LWCNFSALGFMGLGPWDSVSLKTGFRLSNIPYNIVFDPNRRILFAVTNFLLLCLFQVTYELIIFPMRTAVSDFIVISYTKIVSENPYTE